MNLPIAGCTRDLSIQVRSGFATGPLLPKSTWITIQRSLVATVLGLMVRAGERIVMLSSHQAH